MCCCVCFWLFHVGGPYNIGTSPLICSANQRTGFYVIGASIMIELNTFCFDISCGLSLICSNCISSVISQLNCLTIKIMTSWNRSSTATIGNVDSLPSFTPETTESLCNLGGNIPPLYDDLTRELLSVKYFIVTSWNWGPETVWS